MKTPMKTDMTTISTTSSGGGGFASGIPSDRNTIENTDPLSYDQRISDLENRPRMPSAGSGISGDVLELDGSNPRWGSGGLPEIVAGDEVNMSLVLADDGEGGLVPEWAYRLLQE